ncbi:MAG: glycosyltransferase family 2 protein [Bacteroidia bacterium]|nr:glycosyltransferase family 2 protein [Bacteroidia bacterium]
MLSAVILTFNEENNIAECIDSAFKVADEVIVIDSHSTDKTVQIAQNKNAIVKSIEWKGWVVSRNEAILNISFDHILFMDADERLSTGLIQSILTEKSKGFPSKVYSLQRLNHIGNKAIKHGAWFPDNKIRLYKKSEVIWKGGHVHEWADSGQIKAVSLNGFLLHYSYQNASELRSKTKKYALLAAQSLRTKPKVLLLVKMLFSPLFRFVRDYFFKSGYKDNREGFLIACQSAREVFLKNKAALTGVRTQAENNLA